MGQYIHLFKYDITETYFNYASYYLFNIIYESIKICTACF